MENPENYAPVIICIASVLLVGGWLSFLKTALACCRRARLQLLAEDGDKKYTRALKLVDRTGNYQASLRAGIIAAEIFLGCLGGSVIHSVINTNTFSFASGILALLVFSALGGAVFFIFAETIPRTIAFSAPEKYTAFFSRFINIICLFSYPLLLAEKLIIAMIHKFLPGRHSNPGMTEDELRIALMEGEKSGIVESRERTMVEGVFYLGDRPVGTFMTHRSEIKWLDINDDAQKVRELAESEQQYFPVVEGDLDKVSGIVTVQILLAALLKSPWPGLRSLIRQPCFVPETMPALKAFETFKKAETNCLFVMDEYGGFAGILSVRNLIEEIVGQLSAKAGDADEIIQREDGSWLADGSINIDTAAQTLFMPSLTDDAGHSDYHTLAGFILNLAGEIPRTGAFFDYHGFRFTVVDLDGNRIDKILIEKK